MLRSTLPYVLGGVALCLALASGRVGAERFATVALSRGGVARLAAGTFRMGSDDRPQPS